MKIKKTIKKLFSKKYSYLKCYDNYYSKTNPRCTNSKKIVICMFDGKILHGGFSDRLKGIAATYQICKKLGVDFKINFTSPFELNKVLIPNKVNWEINKDEICYNPLDVVAYNIIDMTYELSVEKQKRLFSDLISKDKKQIHIYTNADFSYTDNSFAQLFHELFTISDDIKSEIKRHLYQIGGEYYNVATRFSDLLGDFPEKHLKELNESDRKILIEKCLNKLKEIHNENKCKIFVSSDSETFTNETDKLDFTYSLKGKKVNIDRTDIRDFNILKIAILDFLLISNSKKIIQLKTGDMYFGHFSKAASYLNNVPFELVEF